MLRHQIIAACGAALSVSLAAPALAQYSESDRTDRQREQAQADRRDTDRQDRRNQSDRERRGQTNTDNVLQELEGIWTVEVMMSEEFVKTMQSSGNRDRWSSRDRTQRDRDEQYNETDRETDRRDSDGPRDMTRRGQGGSHESARGIAESRIILGDVLQQQVMLTGGEPGGDAEDMSMRGISYFAFNAESDSYDAVFIGSGKKGIMHEEGKYDAKNQRIIFNSKQAQRDSTRGGRDLEGRQTRDGVRSDATGHDDVVVVLQMDGQESYHVTMYKADAYERASGMGGRAQNGSTGDLPDGALYRAMYERASRADLMRLRQSMQREQQRRDGATGTNPRGDQPQRQRDR